MAESLIPPLPGDTEEIERRKEARRRRRLMEGGWRQDAVERIVEFFQAETAQRLGHVDLTRNLARQIPRELSVRYQSPPRRLHEDDAASDLMAEYVKSSSLWPVAARNERFVVALNSCFLRTDWTAPGTPDEGLMHTVVTPDLVYAEADPERPRVPVYALHARRRTLPGKEQAEWFFDEFDVRDAVPTFRILKPADAGKRPEDVTAQFVSGDLSGAGYHWLDGGRAIVPLVLYQRDPGFAGMHDWREGCEIVDATLIGSALRSMWAYSVRDAAHPVRALADGEFVGGGTNAGSGAHTATSMLSDPTVMHMVRSLNQGAAHALEWGPAVDPERLQLAIDAYEQGAAQAAGLSPDDFVRSGGAESGYAISLKSEAKRREQRRMGPAFERADSVTLGLCASLLNRYRSAGLPEDGWAPQYQDLGLTPSEREARRLDVAARLEQGTASMVDAVMAENPQFTRDEATAFLERVQQERARFRPPQPMI